MQPSDWSILSNVYRALSCYQPRPRLYNGYLRGTERSDVYRVFGLLQGTQGAAVLPHVLQELSGKYPGEVEGQS